MKKNIFAVCDLEVDYAFNFMDYLNQKKNLPFEIQAFTTAESLLAYGKENHIELLLISDKAMRNLEALMIVADKEDMLVLSGTGEVIEPDQPFVAIGSGGNYAYAAANALYNNTDLGAEDIVRKALEIASSICVYTNNNISVEKL